MLEEAIQSARSDFDLTEKEHQRSVTALAELLLTSGESAAEAILKASAPTAPLEARIAALLADSRSWLLSDPDRTLHIGVIFAMWGEQNRLLPKSDDNETGEDSLVTKMEQLEWATQDTAINWQLYAVDDGCPHHSGSLAASIAKEHRLGDKVTVLHLSHALPAESGPLKNLASVDDSRKAGAVILGCIAALEKGADAIIYTDADNSVHLGQLGLLLRPFVEDSAEVVLGDRKQAGSVLVKEGARWGIGIKVLRHMQRMIGKAIFSRGILDTQAAFKLYQADLLEKILVDPTVFDFSFDTDWILGAISHQATIAKVPFAFIDSAAESASITQGPMTTWETLLFGLAKSVKRYGVADKDAAAMIEVLEEEINGHPDLEVIIDLLPEELTDAGESDFGDPQVMSPEALQTWLRDVLGK
ncbi:MAG: glycosyltransferase [Verrucomicrobiota bacterium]